MSAFINTEQTISLSGGGFVFPAPDIGTDYSRNSGGVVNVAGPVIIKDITVIALSGSIASNSGVRLSVHHATSGMTAFLSGQVLFFQDLTGASGLGTGGFTIIPPGYLGVDFVAKSGFVSVNSGTHTFDLVVSYLTRIG